MVHGMNDAPINEMVTRVDLCHPSSGLTFDGVCRGDLPTGAGSLWKDHENTLHLICRGSWEDGFREGQCHSLYRDGTMFIGRYRRGSKHGPGVMIFPNGDRHEGEWINDKRAGMGTFTEALTGNTYAGSWVDGMKSGPGRYSYKSTGSTLQGNWREDVCISGTFE